MKLSRLRGRKVNDYLRRRGAVWKGKTCTVRFLQGAPKNVVSPPASALYVGSSASVKLDKSAVKRNRMRRRCREAFRKTAKEFEKLPTHQLLISPKAASLDCDYGDIVNDAEAFLTSLL